MTPSSFQNAVAAATRPASRSATALKPIVIVCTRAGEPPAPATTECSTAVSLGTPVTPTVRPASSRGFVTLGAGDHRGQRTLHQRHDPDDVLTALAGDGQVVDVEDGEVGPAGLQQPDRIGRRRRHDDVQPNAGTHIVVAGDGLIDPGVHGVGREIEDQGRAGAVRSSADPALPHADTASGEQHGEQGREAAHPAARIGAACRPS